jgi:hypothetical protein
LTFSGRNSPKKGVDTQLDLRYNAQAVGERGTRKALPADMILENDTEMKNAEQLSYPAKLFKKRQSIRKMSSKPVKGNRTGFIKG